MVGIGPLESPAHSLNPKSASPPGSKKVAAGGTVVVEVEVELEVEDTEELVEEVEILVEVL